MKQAPFFRGKGVQRPQKSRTQMGRSTPSLSLPRQDKCHNTLFFKYKTAKDTKGATGEKSTARFSSRRMYPSPQDKARHDWRFQFVFIDYF
ncbi:hypothetical protein [Desulfovibrio sp. Fe33]|uniref:hypothetical protein n=1 Tax=Desulfovibrio sp. Fe33 TaxID=3020842 RepID=UPI00234DB6FD|nr:hypothetical protein [Desulfovibrio sp. Fe33]